MALENATNIGSASSDIGNALSSSISQLFSGKLAELWEVMQFVLKIALAIIIVFILYKLIVGIVGAYLRARDKRITRNLLTDISDNVRQINQKMDVLISKFGRQPAQQAEKEEEPEKSVAKKEKLKKRK